MGELDDVDITILQTLEQDAKTSVKDLSEQLNMTKTPIYERIKRLEKIGAIKGYKAILDQVLMGKAMVVFCFVSLESQQIDNIEQFKSDISKIPEIESCYLLGGQSDFLLKVRVTDLTAYHKFSSGILAGLDNVSKIKSNFVLEEVR